MSDIIKFGSYTFKVNKKNKVLFPDIGLTKEDVMDYYGRISDTMISYMKDRPITMIRFPDNIHGKHFYQKDIPDYFPDWIEREKIQNQDEGSTNYVICNNKATLVYLASQAAITPHIWLSKKGKLDYPDKMIFDLDPSGNDFSEVVSAAKQLKSILFKQLGLPVFVMTTGSRGMHIITPLKQKEDFDSIRDFSQRVAKHLESEHPKTLTSNVRKESRDNKLFIDTACNAFGQTSVTPYAIRPIEGAPVATPLEWEEINHIKSAQKYTIDNIFQRLEQKTDPWKEMYRHAVTLEKARNRLELLTK